jgi:hypothetical protein
MPKKPRPVAEPKLLDADRHKRFVAMAREIGADDDPKVLDRAMDKIAATKAKPSKK